MEAGWRLRGCDLGRCCNYEMAVWERKGEDKAIWRGCFWKKRTEFWRKDQEGCFLGKRRKDFWEDGKELGSYVEGSLAMLVIFRCVWRIVELLLQKNWGARQRRSKKPRNFQTSSFCEFVGGNACTFGDVYILWIRYKSFFFFESHQCGSIGQEMCVVSLLYCCVCQSLNCWGSEKSARHGRVLEMLRC